MDARDLVNFIRKSDDEELSVRILNETLQKYWLRGYEKRDRHELKFKSTRERLKKKQDQEMEIIMEQVSREGYSGEYLKKEAWKRYLKNDPQITEEDVKPKSK